MKQLNQRGAVWLKAISVLLALVAFVSACASQPAGPQVVGVELSTYGIKPSTNTVKAGDVVFRVTNKASDLEHEFLVLDTDAAPGDLPYDTTEGVVPEDQIMSLGEVAELKPGASGELKLTMKPGKYLLICNVATHYKAGMVTPFTVTQ
jgi:uncharacterized cupredoxin-like copper-binding protein